MNNLQNSVSTASSIQKGGRKTATARVHLIPGAGNTVLVNGKPMAEYFHNSRVYLQTLESATSLVKIKPEKFDAHIIVSGGGLSAQAQAIRLALSKAFVDVFPESRTAFKKPGFLTRDARIKERRKYGLKKARKASQFSKR
jgi:small subunit ribosomal protein S9